MADQEQVKRLLQGVDGWNKWRDNNPAIWIDLEKADLTGANLSGAKLSDFHDKQVNLSGAIFTNANLSGAYLGASNLNDANLSNANFQNAVLNKAWLERANLYRTDLRNANFNEADLSGANFNGTILEGSFFESAIFGETVLSRTDLSMVEGLGNLQHSSPSIIGTDTFRLSKGKIPVKFLRGCGLSDWEIESAKLYQEGLQAKDVNDIVYRIYDLRANQAIQINPLFISYSHKDGAFVDAMEKHLDEKGIRFWRDIYDASAGRVEKVLDQAIRHNPTMLLILSENSVISDWVEHEARTAREVEKELRRDVLCPVALDDAWKDCRWPARLREQIMEYNILDFSKWKDEEEFGKVFRKLIGGLDLFYKEG
jgi:hypothetical protein